MVICLSIFHACAKDTGLGREATLASLVESERAFARAAAELGTRDAFIAYLARDAVLFRPRAVNAQSWLQGQAAQPGLLSWKPAFADVSVSGELGFTTGPWDFRPEPKAEPVSYGQYFSFWKKQPDGTWKVVIDHGTSTPASSEPEPLHHPQGGAVDPRWRVDDSHSASERQALLRVDRAFSLAAQVDGVRQAVASYGMSDVRVLRNGAQPLSGRAALQSVLIERAGTFSWVPLGGDISRSGDLGFTYGEYAFTAPGSTEPEEVGNYMRAWRRQPGGAWRVIVDLMTPRPSP